MLVLDNLRKLMLRKGFRVLERPHELNIVGIRSKQRVPTKFDDEFYVFWREANGTWMLRVYKGTTDPGTYYLNHPTWPRGTAIVKQGQYPGAWVLGKHKGQYDALVQRGRITVSLDDNRDSVLDYNGRTANGSGINMHRARLDGLSVTIDKYSAGCQVIADSNQFAELVALARRHVDKKYGNLSYTLIDLRDYKTFRLWQWLMAGLAVSAVLVFGKEEKDPVGALLAKVNKWLTKP